MILHILIYVNGSVNSIAFVDKIVVQVQMVLHGNIISNTRAVHPQFNAVHVSRTCLTRFDTPLSHKAWFVVRYFRDKDQYFDVIFSGRGTSHILMTMTEVEGAIAGRWGVEFLFFVRPVWCASSRQATCQWKCSTECNVLSCVITVFLSVTPQLYCNWLGIRCLKWDAWLIRLLSWTPFSLEGPSLLFL